MKKQDLTTIKQYLLILIVFVGALLAGFTLLGHGESIRKTLSVLLIALVALFAGLGIVDVDQEPLSAAPDKLYFVNYVIDGDTINIEGDMKVRLIGIDAPEGGECFYEEAKNELARLVQGRDVRLEKDVTAVDDYGRILSYVFLPSGDLLENDIFVNDRLLRQGYAREFSYGRNNRYRNVFIKARDQALIDRRGLWGACDEYVSEYEQGKQYREMHELPTDPNCVIKGNISRQGAGKVYAFPGCSNYDLIKIDTRKGEQYFCTEEEAQTAGFRKSGNCP